MDNSTSIGFSKRGGVIHIPREGTGQPEYKQYVRVSFSYQDIWAYQPYTNGTLYGTNEC